jgi:hypothetical protein
MCYSPHTSSYHSTLINHREELHRSICLSHLGKLWVWALKPCASRYGQRGCHCLSGVRSYRVFAEQHYPASPTVMETWSWKQFVYFQKCTHVFIIRGVSTAARDFFLGRWWGRSAIQADGNSHAILSLGKESMLFALKIFNTSHLRGEKPATDNLCCMTQTECALCELYCRLVINYKY